MSYKGFGGGWFIFFGFPASIDTFPDAKFLHFGWIFWFHPWRFFILFFNLSFPSVSLLEKRFDGAKDWKSGILVVDFSP